MHKIGIMQGRLTPPNGRGIQFFPGGDGEWQEEFKRAQKLGLKAIDFNFDLDRYEENPLWTEKGIKEIKSMISLSGVPVTYITADFFMRRPFFRIDAKSRKENERIFMKLMEAAEKIGTKYIEMPILDNSSIETAEERKIFVDVMQRALKKAPRGMTISLEGDLSPESFLNLLGEIGDSRVKIVYDIGNRTGQGYSPENEIPLLHEHITHIHMKDKKFRGKTVPLGTGSSNFALIFKALANTGFKGDFILQAARGEDGKEIETVSGYKKFTEGLIRKYLQK